MAELQHLLPPVVLANPPDARADYRHEYAHYAAQLGCDVRNIKLYVAVGRGVKPDPDLPPFDSPPDFLLWWRRRMSRPPSEKVLAFARSVAAPGPSASATPPPPLPPAAGAPPPPAEPKAAPLAFDLTGAGGFEASVRELRATVAAAQRRLRRRDARRSARRGRSLRAASAR
jgi:hypothetical protein